MFSSSNVWIFVFARLAAMALWFAASRVSVLCATVDSSFSDAFFEGNHTAGFKIRLEEKEVAALREQPRTYVRGVVTEGGRSFENVGIRLKGRTSFRPVDHKPSLTLKFDHFIAGQTYGGIKKLFLNNSVQDGSFMHELLASQLCLDAGVPAARVSYARVELNGRDLGIFVATEAMNKDFLRGHFKYAQGNLYEGTGQDIDKELEQDNGSECSRADLHALLQACREGDPAKRSEFLRERLDVERFIAFVAIQMCLGFTDGYVTGRNNYRIYDNPESGRMVFIPHGMDTAFVNGGALRPPDRGSIVVQAVLTVPGMFKDYRRACTNVVLNVWRLESLTNRIETALTKLRSLARTDSENNTFTLAAAGMKQRVTERRAELAGALSQLEIPAAEGGVVKVGGWAPRNEGNNPELEFAKEGERNLLHIRVGSGGGRGAWRAKVALAEGYYLFVAQVRTLGVAAEPNNQPSGVGLRISRESPAAGLLGNNDWREISHSVVVPPGGRQIELICEFRARAGEAWFDADSLRMIRQP